MKRLFKLGLLCLIAFIFCTGCDGSITRAIRHAGFTLNGDSFTCGKFYPRDKDDIYYEKIRYYLGTHIIDDDGKIYELSLSQKYSNGENCVEAATTLHVKAILDNRIIKGTDNKYYYLGAQSKGAESYSAVPTTDNSYTVYNILLKDNDVVKVMSADSSQGLYYVLKTDGNIYGYTIAASQNRNTSPRLTGTQIIYDKNDYEGEIIDFNYAGDSLNTFVKTADKIFRMRASNLEECSKYADIDCIYEMSEDTVLEKYKDRIIAFNGSVLIMDYKKMFTVAS